MKSNAPPHDTSLDPQMVNRKLNTPQTDVPLYDDLALDSGDIYNYYNAVPGALQTPPFVPTTALPTVSTIPQGVVYYVTNGDGQSSYTQIPHTVQSNPSSYIAPQPLPTPEPELQLRTFAPPNIVPGACDASQHSGNWQKPLPLSPGAEPFLAPQYWEPSIGQQRLHDVSPATSNFDWSLSNIRRGPFATHIESTQGAWPQGRANWATGSPTYLQPSPVTTVEGGTYEADPPDSPTKSESSKPSQEGKQPALGWAHSDASSFANGEDHHPVEWTAGDVAVLGKRGRQGRLEDTKRRKIAGMRKSRACIWCRLKKKECDNIGTTCERCKRNIATSTLGPITCLRPPLSQFSGAILPGQSAFYTHAEVLELRSRHPALTKHRSFKPLKLGPKTLPTEWPQSTPNRRSPRDSYIDSSYVIPLELVRDPKRQLSTSLDTLLARPWEDLRSYMDADRRLGLLEYIHRFYVKSNHLPILRDALKLIMLFRFNAWPNFVAPSSHDDGRSQTTIPPVEAATSNSAKAATRPANLDFLHGQISMHCGNHFRRTLETVLTGLQKMILERKKDNWPVVISVLMVLSILRDICNDLELDPPSPEWQGLQQLYSAAYGSYHSQMKDLDRQPDTDVQDQNMLDFIRSFRHTVSTAAPTSEEKTVINLSLGRGVNYLVTNHHLRQVLGVET